MTTPAPPPAGASKPDWRAWARHRRAGIDWAATSAAIVAALAGWEPLTAAGTTLLYLPLPDEVDLMGLRDAGLDTRFVATRTPDRGGELTVHDLDGPLQVHRHGFLQPHPKTPQVDPEEIDILLLPGLAFDLYGNRLGRGAGYFDRLLPRCRNDAARVGVVPAALVVDLLPVEPHDVHVGVLATDEGMIEVAPGGGQSRTTR
jgi:5-formyltetrahydrofolate cyclo-ligase